MTSIASELQNFKKTAAEAQIKLATQRRANANLATAAVLTTLCGLFASVPISIRQRDWKVWALPFLAAFSLAVVGYDDKKGDINPGAKALALLTQGGVAAWIMKQNKDEAKVKLSSEEEAN